MSQKVVFVCYRRTQDVIKLAIGRLANNELSFDNYLPRTMGLLRARPPHTGKQCSVIVLKVFVRVFLESEKNKIGKNQAALASISCVSSPNCSPSISCLS